MTVTCIRTIALLMYSIFIKLIIGVLEGFSPNVVWFVGTKF